MGGVSMKCKEFMVGDWILINNIPHKIQAIDSIDAEIRADDELYYIGEDRYHSEDKIESVPITPEILEKNSIRKRRDEYAVFGWEGMKLWYVTLEDFKPQYDFWFITSSDRDLNISGQIRYVHQLQHALRICGLDELADNFKI